MHVYAAPQQKAALTVVKNGVEIPSNSAVA